MNINFNVVKIISKRDLRLYFSNPTGYLFITLFIFLSAAAAFWQERFFADNLANLDKLNDYFPLLLIFFIPALTMNIWSEERRQGTDELLFTLPATDVEVVLGKYLAVLGIYTASLILSLSHVLVLFWLGSPDIGLMFANYIGYWLIGAALLATGMFASLLSVNATFSFVLGAAFCAIFVYIPKMGWLTGDWLSGLLEKLGVTTYFRDFSGGVVSLSGLAYFLFLAGAVLYFNVILVSRRHWPAVADGYKMWTHHLVRAIALIVAAYSLVFIFDRFTIRLDTTAEQLHSLSKKTDEIISSLPNDRKVLVQAYVSPDAPRDYVEKRSELLNMLDEIGAMSGGKVQVLINNTTPFSSESREARDKFRIEPRDVMTSKYGRAETSQLYMGVAFTSGTNEEVIPFFDKGLPVEYEVVRSIRAVSQSARKKVGFVQTAVKLFGDFDFQAGRSTPPWRVVDELKKQFDVAMVNPRDSISEIYDALIVALPSSLTQPEMDNLKTYILAGNPTVLLIDPLPIVEVGLSPILPSNAQVSPFMRNQQQDQEPKGDLQAFLNDIGLNWQPDQIVWDAYNPHPDLAQVQQEVVFVGSGNRNPQAFNQNFPVTSGLQEVVMLFPGYIGAPVDPGLTYTPLLETGALSGTHLWYSLVRRGMFGLSLDPNPPRRPSPQVYDLAARISGVFTAPTADGDKTPPSNRQVNLLAIADLDFISSQFFSIREAGLGNLDFDNVSFFLNCIDVMAGDSSFIDLRKRRVRHRTLTAVEARTQEFIQRRIDQEKEAEESAQKALAEARENLNQKVAEVQNRTDLDAQTKQIMAQNLQEVENRRFENVKTNIEARRDETTRKAYEDMEGSIRKIQTRIKTLAVALPPIPVFVVGVLIFIRRRKREYEGALAARRLRS